MKHSMSTNENILLDENWYDFEASGFYPGLVLWNLQKSCGGLDCMVFINWFIFNN